MSKKIKPIYHIRHEAGANEWCVYYGEELVGFFRAKSRSKKEMQRLLDHVNAEVNNG